jgi:hypothetical protein
MKGFLKVPPTKVIHRLTEECGQKNHLRIVDPNRPVKEGFVTGLLILSEIIFDQNHKRATLSYDFHCGLLCCNSETVVYERKRGAWKRKRSKESCGFGVY